MRNNIKFEENYLRLSPLTSVRKKELELLVRESVADFKGSFYDLEKAIGMLHMGDHFGWRVLVLVHNKRTIRKYEEILNINIKEFFPEEGAAAYRSVGLTAAKKIGNFWKVVSGEKKVANKADME